jgi:hypothetical protein
MADEDAVRILPEILRLGEPMENGSVGVAFGKLFDDDMVNSEFPGLSGALKAAKRAGKVKFKPMMLMKGMHDKIIIELLDPGSVDGGGGGAEGEESDVVGDAASNSGLPPVPPSTAAWGRGSVAPQEPSVPVVAPGARPSAAPPPAWSWGASPNKIKEDAETAKLQVIQDAQDKKDQEERERIEEGERKVAETARDAELDREYEEEQAREAAAAADTAAAGTAAAAAKESGADTPKTSEAPVAGESVGGGAGASASGSDDGGHDGDEAGDEAGGGTAVEDEDEDADLRAVFTALSVKDSATGKTTISFYRALEIPDLAEQLEEGLITVEKLKAIWALLTKKKEASTLGFKKFKRFITVCEKAVDVDDSLATKSSSGGVVGGATAAAGGGGGGKAKAEGGAEMAGWYSPSWSGGGADGEAASFMNPMASGAGMVGMSFEQGYGTSWDDRRRESEFHGLGHVENTVQVSARSHQNLSATMMRTAPPRRETPATEKNQRTADANAKRTAIDGEKRAQYQAKELEKQKKAQRLKRQASQGRRDRRGTKDKHAHRRAGGVLTLMCSKIDEEVSKVTQRVSA